MNTVAFFSLLLKIEKKLEIFHLNICLNWIQATLFWLL